MSAIEAFLNGSPVSLEETSATIGITKGLLTEEVRSGTRQRVWGMAALLVSGYFPKLIVYYIAGEIWVF
jgi:hypothetical protein